MLTTVLLAGSLWSASMSPREVPAQAVTITPIEKIADPLATDLALIALGTGLDLLSTDYNIHKSGGKCVEANPLGQRPEGRVALKIGAGAIRGVGAYWLRRGGHRRAANIARWLGVAVDGGLVINNMWCGSKQ